MDASRKAQRYEILPLKLLVNAIVLLVERLGMFWEMTASEFCNTGVSNTWWQLVLYFTME